VPASVIADDQPVGVLAIVADPSTATQQTKRLPAVLFSLVPNAGVTEAPDAPWLTAPIVPTSA
jgi:hypothetical protein